LITRTKITSASGIYLLQSIHNGKRYVGSAVCFKIRQYGHFYKLRKNKHSNRHLQNHYNKYGESDLAFSILELCPKENLIEREQHYIDTLKPEFNLSPTAGSTLGVQMSEESKSKKSLKMKGVANIGEKNGMYGKNTWMKGKYHSEESRNKIKNALAKLHRSSPMKGKTHTPEAIEKNRIAHLNKITSEQTKIKLSKALSIPVYQFDKNGNFIASYISRIEAAKITGANDTQIARCILGRNHCKTAGGFIWKNTKN
jgi:group I intron endonuclease